MSHLPESTWVCQNPTVCWYQVWQGCSQQDQVLQDGKGSDLWCFHGRRHHQCFQGRHLWHFWGSKCIWFHYIICRCLLRTIVQGTNWQTNNSLTTNGTGSCLQEGTVKIRLINDAGTQHIFILDDCLYHPNSPVKLLSMRQLAEKFLNANGNLDEETCIKSRYLTHVLTWSFGQSKKTFPTPVSVLPELLFDEGFWMYKSFCMQAHSCVRPSGLLD